MKIVSDELVKIRNHLVDTNCDDDEDTLGEVIDKIIALEMKLDDTEIKCKKCGSRDIWFL